MFIRHSKFLFALLCAALAGPALATPPGLSLAEAQRLAVQRSLQLQAADHAGHAAREMAHAAGQLPDPVLRVGIDNLPVQGPDRYSTTRDGMTMRRLGVMQEFVRGDKRAARSERYLREADKAAAEKNMAQAAISRDAALAWLKRWYLQQMREQSEQLLQQARLEVQAADAAYRAGRGGQAEVFGARAALVEMEDRAAEIARRERSAATMLARWVGPAADQPLSGAPDIASLRLDMAALENELAHHPEIAVRARAEDVARSQARIAEAERRPDWSMEVMFGQRPSYDNMLSLTVSIPLPWDRANRQDRELAARLAEAEQMRAEREEALRAHVADVRALLLEWESGRARAARLREQLLPLAQQRTAAALAAYRGNRGALEDVLRARSAEVDARMQVLQLDMETARAWALLNYMTPAHDGAQQGVPQ